MHHGSKGFIEATSLECCLPLLQQFEERAWGNLFTPDNASATESWPKEETVTIERKPTQTVEEADWPTWTRGSESWLERSSTSSETTSVKTRLEDKCSSLQVEPINKLSKARGTECALDPEAIFKDMTVAVP